MLRIPIWISSKRGSAGEHWRRSFRLTVSQRFSERCRTCAPAVSPSSWKRQITGKNFDWSETSLRSAVAFQWICVIASEEAFDVVDTHLWAASTNKTSREICLSFPRARRYTYPKLRHSALLTNQDNLTGTSAKHVILGGIIRKTNRYRPYKQQYLDSDLGLSKPHGPVRATRQAYEPDVRYLNCVVFIV